MHECNPVAADLAIVDRSAWMFRGTGLRDGDVLPWLVGSEYDRVQGDAPTPRAIEVLAHSPIDCAGRPSHSDTSAWNCCTPFDPLRP